MKVLLAIDGSAHSDVAIAEIARRPWPRDTEVLVMTVVHAAAPFLPDPSLVLAAAHVQQIQQGYDHAPALVRSACEQLRRSAPYLNVQTTVDEGVPKDAIVDAARRWNADLIVLGSHGYGRIRRILLGSVAMGVLSEAPCSVLVARVKQNTEEGELETPVTACRGTDRRPGRNALSLCRGGRAPTNPERVSRGRSHAP